MIQVYHGAWRESNVAIQWDKKQVIVQSLFFKMLFYSSRYNDFSPRYSHLNKKAAFFTVEMHVHAYIESKRTHAQAHIRSQPRERFGVLKY